jgi:predicted transposase YbfD/YdcC
MSFLTHFAELEDGRTDINVKYELLDVVFLTLVAVLAGAEGWQDIERFGDAKLEWLRRYRRFASGIPRRHTVARIIGALRPEGLLKGFVSWVNEVRAGRGRSQLAIDGKTLRRSHHGEKTTALHLLSAMAVDSGLVVYQTPSLGKKNEIKTVQQLLEVLDVSGTCVSLDAMHCQTETCEGNAGEVGGLCYPGKSQSGPVIPGNSGLFFTRPGGMSRRQLHRGGLRTWTKDTVVWSNVLTFAWR